MDCEKYIEYVNSNTESIASYVDACLEAEKESIKADLIALIKAKIIPPPKHYELTHYNDPPYDHSGELVEGGIIDINRTVVDFLEDEYIGNWVASFESGCGIKWMTYDDALSLDTGAWGTTIMYSAICKRIEAEFSVSLSDDELEQIADSCDGFNDIFGMSHTVWAFLLPSAVAEFVGIDQLKLSEL